VCEAGEGISEAQKRARATISKAKLDHHEIQRIRRRNDMDTATGRMLSVYESSSDGWFIGRYINLHKVLYDNQSVPVYVQFESSNAIMLILTFRPWGIKSLRTLPYSLQTPAIPLPAMPCRPSPQCRQPPAPSLSHANITNKAATLIQAQACIVQQRNLYAFFHFGHAAFSTSSSASSSCRFSSRTPVRRSIFWHLMKGVRYRIL